MRHGFARLWAASGLSNVADGLGAVAFPWLATTLTDSALLIALTGVATRLPWLLFSLPAGVLADRLDRRRVMVTMNAARGIVLAALALLTAVGGLTLPLLYAGALLLGFAEVLVDNTSQVILPAVVGRDGLERANGRLMATHFVAEDFGGRPLGGVLVGAALALPFAAGAGLVSVAAVLLLTLRGSFRAIPGPSGPPGAGRESGRRSMRAEMAQGVRWLWRHPLLRPLAVTLAVVNGASQAGMAVYVLYAQELLDLGAVGFAVLGSAFGAGGVIGGLVAEAVSRRLGRARSLVLLVVVWTAAYAVMGLVAQAYVVAVAMAATGVVAVLWNVVTVSMRQTLVPDHLLGRVNSVYRLLGWGAIPLGMAAGGGLVTLVETLASREAALRAPYLVAAAASLGLLLYVRRHLNAAAIARAYAAGADAPPAPAPARPREEA